MDDRVTMEEGEQRDPHDEIVRIEARMEQLEAQIESCRKFVLIARVAAALGGALLAALMFGAIRFDPVAMAASIAAVLCGIVLGGSNSSTAREAAAQLAAAEAKRAALIGAMRLRVVGDRDDAPSTYH
jgi:uncharacterized protein YacL